MSSTIVAFTSLVFTLLSVLTTFFAGPAKTNSPPSPSVASASPTSAPPAATAEKKSQPANVEETSPMFDFTHVLNANSSYYRVAQTKGGDDDRVPETDRPTDGRLRAGTRLRYLGQVGDFAKVSTEQGITVLLPAKSVRPSSDEAEKQLAELVAGNNQFAVDLYRQLSAGQQGNLFLSPYSISSALGMTYFGAGAETADQMRTALRLRLDGQQLGQGYAALHAILNSNQEGAVRLAIANRLWAQQGIALLPDFLDVTKKYFGAGLGEVDFEGQTEKARTTINAWIAAQTQDKIPELLASGTLDPLTQLVLTNAIYFKGAWEDEFDKADTKDAAFFVAADRKVTVPMMYQQERFGYRQLDQLQVLELPYANNDLSMVILLPTKVDGLADLEKSLTAEKLTEWTTANAWSEVKVFLPRFKLDSQFELKQALSQLGMPVAFSPSADFSGISSAAQLMLSAVIHQATVEVNEEGTVAAAATAITLTPTAMPNPQRVPTFRADHPFLFAIRDNRTGEILFLGRVLEPKS